LALPRTLARREGLRLFVVGGAVRDLLLRRPVEDVDLAVEGDAVLFARRLAAELRIRPRLHERFGTATLELPGGSRIDLATTRRESYERAGALPRVRPGPIEEDLMRRDFTIHAMALEIAPGRRMRLLDPSGGRRDLRSRLLRMLHPESPFDDPTRAFRAARYANRLGFQVETTTRAWIRKAVRARAFDAVSGDRLRREVRLLFSEKNRAGAVAWMGRLHLASTLHPSLRSGAAVAAPLRCVERLAVGMRVRTTWLLYLLIWARPLSARDLEALSRRLDLTGEERRTLLEWRKTRKTLALGLRGRTVWRPVTGVSPDELLAAAALLPGRLDRRRLRRMLSAKPLSLAIQGRDLLAAGVPSGPVIGRALAQTLSARRRHAISRKEELEYALQTARKESP
jgi:tRNA nucleotidyltransferase (CCA-adding enzyme)